QRVKGASAPCPTPTAPALGCDGRLLAELRRRRIPANRRTLPPASRSTSHARIPGSGRPLCRRPADQESRGEAVSVPLSPTCEYCTRRAGSSSCVAVPPSTVLAGRRRVREPPAPWVEK